VASDLPYLWLSTEALHNLVVHKNLQYGLRGAAAGGRQLYWSLPRRAGGPGGGYESWAGVPGALLSDPHLVEQRSVHRLLLVAADPGGYEDCR
jgi:hypothetical protein